VKIDLYHLYRRLSLTNLAYPIVMDVLKMWAISVGWQTHVSVCKESQVDFNTDANVVGFSVYTQTAEANYRVAKSLRRRGKIVIFGGPHFRGPQTYLEAFPYCDIIVNSICESQWKNLLKGITEGTIGPNTQRPLLVIDKERRFRYPRKPFQAFNEKRWYQFPSIPTSLGCPYQCDFCSPFMKGEYILRDIDLICNEVALVPGKNVWLCDATFGLSKPFTTKLMMALAPLKKKLVVETTLARLQDKEIIKALALGGVKWITVGVETLSSRLAKHGSGIIDDALRDVIHCAHDYGIIVQGNFICGLDSDGPEIFDQIYDSYQKSKIDAVMVNILIPYPNTILFHRLKREGRIIDNNWEHYDKCHVVYRPKRMTVDQLISGYIQLSRCLFKTKQLLQESVSLFRSKGLTFDAAAVIGHKMGFLFDTPRKERLLRSDQIKLYQDHDDYSQYTEKS
jgi:radical SAM superfamily enzyme YgiQ (UPF0313 family)